MIRITSDPEEIDFRLAHGWVASTYWSTNIPWELFEQACANSLVYAALDADRQVGFARVVSDCATFAWLCDVFVVEHARGHGVGRQLIAAVMADSRLQRLRQVLLATRDAHGLYAKFGFQPIGDPDGRFMRIFHPPTEAYGSSEAYFNEVAGQWDQMRASFFSEAVRDQAIAVAAVQPGTVAADIGAGTGFVTKGLISLGVRVIAVDQSPAMIAEIQKKFPPVLGVDVRLGPGHAIPIEDGSVDYAFANMYLHHVEDPQRAITEMVRILKPGGKLVVTDVDQHDFDFLRTEHHDVWLGFRRDAVETWLRRTGLQRVVVTSANERCSSTASSGSVTADLDIFVASGEKLVSKAQSRRASLPARPRH